MLTFTFKCHSTYTDSIVAWHLAKEGGLNPQLLYVTDSRYEYEENWRIQKIAETLHSPIHVGNAEISYFWILRKI